MVIFKPYYKLLENLEIKKLITRLTIPLYAKPNGHMYYILIKNNKRDKLIKYLQQKNKHSLSLYSITQLPWKIKSNNKIRHVQN